MKLFSELGWPMPQVRSGQKRARCHGISRDGQGYPMQQLEGRMPSLQPKGGQMFPRTQESHRYQLRDIHGAVDGKESSPAQQLLPQYQAF